MTALLINSAFAQAQEIVPDRSAMARAAPGALVSIVIAFYNEENTIDALFGELLRAAGAMGCRVEYVCVNDGSRDDTLGLLREKMRSIAAIRIVDLARNFGKEAAMMAGLAHARGDAVILIDADLQDPPALMAQFVAKWREGFDVVYGIRSSRRADTALSVSPKAVTRRQRWSRSILIGSAMPGRYRDSSPLSALVWTEPSPRRSGRAEPTPITCGGCPSWVAGSGIRPTRTSSSWWTMMHGFGFTARAVVRRPTRVRWPATAISHKAPTRSSTPTIEMSAARTPTSTWAVAAAMTGRRGDNSSVQCPPTSPRTSASDAKR